MKGFPRCQHPHAPPEANAGRSHADFRVYPVPVEETPATDRTLTINGEPVFIHHARVSAYPVNEFCPDHQRPLEQTELASFASWDMTAPVDIAVKSHQPIGTAVIRPQARGITPDIDGDTIRFAIEQPGQYTVEINGVHHALHLFANPAEAAAPEPDADNVIYFGPGVHCAGIIRPQSGQIVYIAGGAIVYGAILAEKVQNVTVCGRGILDGSKFRREALTGLVCLYDCDHVSIEGITLRDAPVFTVMPMACRDLHIRNIKIIGNWRYNSDGIDFSNCRSCSVEDSFIRTFDDSICVKGYVNFGPFLYRLRIVDGLMDGRFSVDGVEGTFAELQSRFGKYPCSPDMCDDIQVRRCVIWCDWGRPLEIGAETVAHEIHDVLFEDCDLIHCPGCHAVMCVQNCDHALCRDITYRNIRVELDDEPPQPVIASIPDEPYEVPYEGYLPALIRLANQVGYVSFDTERGRIEDIRFENIDVIAPAMPRSQLLGFDAEHLVQRVSIENLRLNGQPVSDLKGAGIEMNAFVREVTLQTPGTEC